MSAKGACLDDRDRDGKGGHERWHFGKQDTPPIRAKVTDRAALHVQKPAPSAVQTGGRAMTPPPVQQCKPVAGAQTCALTPRW